MTTNTGPIKLRLLAETRPCLMVDVNALHELAAAWEADRAALERARALEAKWRTLAAQSPTLFVHLGPASDELAAALGSGGAA